MSNDVLGRITCQAGGRAAIMQTKRKGKHLYTRCECCGLDQRTGAAVQQWIWDNAEWIGEPPTAPVNVDTTGAKAKPEPKPETEQEPDFDPDTDMPETEPETARKPKGRVMGVVLAGLGLAGLATAIIRA